MPSLNTSPRATLIRGLSSLDPESFQPHRLHSEDPTWANTNCYSDVWIELLSALQLDPVPAMSCAVSAQFSGDQWEFLKPRSNDLETLYGLRFGEYLLWKPITEHLRAQFELGNFAMVEVDSYYLPDTAGTTYRTEHGKTSIIPLRIDVPAAQLIYLHNSGLYRLDGEDFEATLGAGALQGFVPSPYVDLIDTAGLKHPDPAELLASAELVFAAHLQRISESAQTRPMNQLSEYLDRQSTPLAEYGLPYFHQLAFATTRQAGLTAMLAAEFCRWLSAARAAGKPTTGQPAGRQSDGRQSGNGPEPDPLGQAAEAFSACSSSAKQLQFKLARIASGRNTSTESVLAALTAQWELAIGILQNNGTAHG